MVNPLNESSPIYIQVLKRSHESWAFSTNPMPVCHGRDLQMLERPHESRYFSTNLVHLDAISLNNKNFFYEESLTRGSLFEMYESQKLLYKKLIRNCSFHEYASFWMNACLFHPKPAYFIPVWGCKQLNHQVKDSFRATWRLRGGPKQ